VQTVDPGTARAAILHQPDAALGCVMENQILTKSGVPVKRHIGKGPSVNSNMCLSTDSGRRV
jgi:hypothetical protein